MRSLPWWAVACVACGSVANKTPDARVDASPDALACTASELACSGACIDPMTDANHCGACDLACGAGEMCAAGHCADNITHCSQIHDINPAAPSTFYTLNDQSVIYCDMGDMLQHGTDVVMAQFDSGPAGYTVIGANDLATAGGQAAFVALYNRTGGMRVVTAWMSMDCCFKNDGMQASNDMLFFAGQSTFPAVGTTTECNQTPTYMTTSLYDLQVNLPGGPQYNAAPLAANFFATHAATVVQGCGTPELNPAIFWVSKPW